MDCNTKQKRLGKKINTTNTNNYEPRINEIMFELGECQEEELISKVQKLCMI